MSGQTLAEARRAWAIYALLVLAVGIAALGVVQQRDQGGLALARTAASDELHLLSAIVQSQLDRGEYRAATSLIDSAGKSGRRIVTLSLQGHDGAILAGYQRKDPAADTLRLTSDLDYGYDGHARIDLAFDLGPTLSAQRKLVGGIAAVYLSSMLAIGILLHLNLERRRALVRLRDTAEVLENYFDYALDLFYVKSGPSIRRINRQWEVLLGRSIAEIQRSGFRPLTHPDDLPQTASQVDSLSEQDDIVEFTNRLQHRDGSYRYIEWRIRHKGGTNYGAARDVTQRILQDREISFLNRVYATLSQTNQAIARCDDEDRLFQDICQIAVDFGGMKLAWIGKQERGTGRILPMARYGARAELLDGIEFSARAEEPAGQGPAGIAFRGEASFANDWRDNANLAYWREKYPDWSWGSSAALPIRRAGQPYAVLSFYDDVPLTFTGKIVDLLREMATDIEFALSRLDLETMHRAAEQEARIAAIAFETPESMIVMDADGGILRVNAAFTRTTGYTQAEVLGRNPNFLQSGRHPPEFFTDMWHQVRTTGHFQGEIWDRRKSGEVYPKWLTVSSVRNADGAITHYVGSFTDISERKEAAEAITRLAYYDSLTALPNRQLMMERLKRSLRFFSRSGRSVAVLILDLDNFKAINDTLGHDEGDHLLQEVAQRLRACVREQDTVARFGGDEFVVLLEDLENPRERAALLAKAVSDKLLLALNRPFLLHGREFACSASIGLTLWHGDPQVDAQELLKRSDMAMYAAKRAGRNVARFFDPVMQTAIETRSRMETQLRAALALGQFQLHYQPQVRSDGSIFGAEALLRWRDPQRGMISPAEFIPLAEESDLILPIGRWVLETACRQIRAWSASAATRDLTLSVNISPKQFIAEGFVDEVIDVLAETGADGSRLQLEITEGMLLTDIDGTIASMGKLRRKGVTFSLDDFGTGYSSLLYLQRLPLQLLKIDQSFIRDLGENQRSNAIVRTVIQMSQSLELDVVAEGVETEEQRRLLLAWGCNNYQGYLFGRPAPIESLALPNS